MQKIPMTPGGLKTLEDELRQLKSAERPAVIRAIAEARDHGDLSENAEYHAARERQSFIEGRITELEDIVSRAQVIDVSQLTGDTVHLALPSLSPTRTAMTNWSIRSSEPTKPISDPVVCRCIPRSPGP